MSAQLHDLLAEAQLEGRVGPGSIDTFIEHSLHFVELVTALKPEGPVLDLGSGGGIPGLVLAEVFSGRQFTLLDGRTERAQALERAVATLGLSDRVHVIGTRAEIAGREASLRGCFDLVVARSFGAPAVLAECAAPFLHREGHLVVSEPPSLSSDPPSRWLAPGCAQVGLELVDTVIGPPAFAVLRQATPCPLRATHAG